jgi:glycosyltransferase involved in cell wall biosynthesis
MISIIIPTLNEEKYLEDTFKSLASIGDIPHEVIISDGGSTDKTQEIAKQYGSKIVVWDKPGVRQTFGQAKNSGASLAIGEFLLFMDADVILKNPHEDLQLILKKFALERKLVALSVPLKVRPEYAWLRDYFFIEPLNWWYLFSNNILNFATASGEFQMFRTAPFREVGGFNEKLVAGEDNDVFYRMSKQGDFTIFAGIYAYHTCRRPHKIGWIHLYGIWAKNGLWVTLFNKSAYKEWKVIR